MVEYVVYATPAFFETSHQVLRWGNATTIAEANAQAINAGEAVGIVTGLPSGNYAFGYVFDTSTGSWTQAPGAPGGGQTTAEAEALAQGRRQKIVALLRASDWTQLPDAVLTTGQKAQWVTYRNALRAMFSGSCAINSNACDEGFPTPPATPEFPAMN